MYQKLEECPSCQHPKFSNYKICTDYSVSSEGFALVKCDHCHLVFTNPRPDEYNIANYYKSNDYISHTNKATNLVNLIYKQVRFITLRQKLKLITSYTSKTHLLDYGCGTGNFLNHCKRQGFDVDGFEPDQQASALASTLLQKDVYTSTNDLQASSRKYDIITAWHVIEHVADLKNVLKVLRMSLRSDGYLFIAVPNLQSFDAKHYDQYWAAYDVPRHLYHFSRDSFAHLMKQSRLHIKNIHPMKFDSYYVSLLSEKYKTGKSNFFKALKIGHKSNLQASKNGEYSSLIYVVTK